MRPRDWFSGAGPKPLQAAVVKSRGGERWTIRAGWSHPYARGVLNGVEMREPYLILGENVDIAQHIAHLQEPVNGC